MLKKFLCSMALLIVSLNVICALEYNSDDLRTRPLIHDDQQFWYNLHASPSVCSYFRDGETRTPGQVDFQFKRSLARFEHNDPRYIHVIDQRIGDEWISVGTVVLGGSDKPNFLECAMIMHPLYDSDSNTFMNDKNINSAIQVKELADINKNLIPVWGQKIASRIAEWGLSEYVSLLRKSHVTYEWNDDSTNKIYTESFDGKKFLGISATASNPASRRLLVKYGFVEIKEIDCKWGKKHSYEYKFTNPSVTKIEAIDDSSKSSICCCSIF